MDSYTKRLLRWEVWLDLGALSLVVSGFALYKLEIVRWKWLIHPIIPLGLMFWIIVVNRAVYYLGISHIRRSQKGSREDNP